MKIIWFDFEILCLSSQPIVQLNYIIYFQIPGSFLTTFCTSFWKRVHNSKQIVNMRGLFVLTVVYVDMTTYPVTKYYYIIERVYFIYRLLVLFMSTLSFLLFLYTVSGSYKKDYLHASIDILFYISSILLTQWKNIRLFYTTFTLTIQKRSRFEPSLPSPLIVATPLDKSSNKEIASPSPLPCESWIFVKKNPDRKKANSTLPHLRTDFQNMMGEERLNALSLVYIHWDIFLDCDKIIDIYTSKYSRRMLLINHLSVETFNARKTYKAYIHIKLINFRIFSLYFIVVIGKNFCFTSTN